MILQQHEAPFPSPVRCQIVIGMFDNLQIDIRELRDVAAAPASVQPRRPPKFPHLWPG
jgi:hypothetical protein